MRKSLWIILAVMIVAVGAPNAQADTVTTFDVSGTVEPAVSFLTGTTFSGTLTIDVTSGAITAVDITFPGLPIFDRLVFQGPDGSDWDVSARTSIGVVGLFLSFTTAPTPGSLVGFTGGTITGREVIDALEDPLYNVTGGSVTAPTATPEPSTVALMLLGVGLVFVLRKRNSRGHQLAT